MMTTTQTFYCSDCGCTVDADTHYCAACDNLNPDTTTNPEHEHRPREMDNGTIECAGCGQTLTL